jgi:hypothetical protein
LGIFKVDLEYSIKDFTRTNWTLNECKKEARKYNSRYEWQRKSRGSYSSSQRNGWIDQCSKHMLSRKELITKWTLDACKREARKYKSRHEWHIKASGSYNSALKNGWLDLCCKHMKVLMGKWTLEACKKEARKYKSRYEWRKRSSGSYTSALKKGWIDQCSKHMLSRRELMTKWTLDACKREARKYKSRHEWRRKSGGSYCASQKNGWLDKCCKHMK